MAARQAAVNCRPLKEPPCFTATVRHRLAMGGFYLAAAAPKTCNRARARGHSYGRALRGVADRLLGVACVLLRRQVLFDPDHGKSAAA